MDKKPSLVKLASLIFGVSVLCFSVVNIAVATWAPPQSNPPNGNVSAPVNVGNTSQAKTGAFAVGTSTLVDSALTLSSNPSTPSYSPTLNVNGSIYSTGGAYINSGGASVGLVVPLGNAGIGTGTPNAKLEVDGSGFSPSTGINKSALMLGGSYGGGLLFKDTNYAGIWTTGSGQVLNFSTNGTSTNGFGTSLGQIVFNNGKVGIGINPSYPIQIAGTGTLGYFGNGAVTDSAYEYFNGRAIFGYNGSSGNVIIQGIGGKGIEFNVNTGTFGFGTAMKLDSLGNLTVGTATTPGFRVSAAGDLNRINGVAYTWPATQASTVTYLQNSGNGTLSWAVVSGQVPNSRTLTFSNGANISVSPNTAQDLSANRTWTIGLTGIIPVANGGTGQGTLTQYGVLYGNGTSPVLNTGAGTLNYVLASGGSSAAPSWKSLSDLGVTNYWSYDATNHYLYPVNYSNDKVGIGTNSPSENLTVSGGNSVLGIVNTGDVGGPWGFLRDTYGTLYLGMKNTSNTYYNRFAINGTTGAVGSVTNNGISGPAFRNVLDDGNGKLGVGTTSPQQALDVNGTIAFGQGTTVSSSTSAATLVNPTGGSALIGRGSVSNFAFDVQDGGGRINFLWNASSSVTSSSVPSAGTYLVNGESAVRFAVNTNGTSGAYFGFYGAPSGTAGNAISWTQISEFKSAGDIWLSPRGTNSDFYIDNSGKVGIGTTTPGARLDIAGNIKIVDGTQGNGKVLTSDANGLASWADTSSYWTQSGSNLYPNNTSWNVGIGKSTPAYKLDVNGTIRSFVSSDANLILAKTTTGGAIQFSDGNNNMGLIEADAAHAIEFWTNTTTPSSVQTEKMRIASNGNVGIGTTTPAEKLDVNGNINISMASGAINHENNSPLYINSYNQIQFRMQAGGATSGNFQVNNSNNNAVFSVNNNGQVGIGTTSPAQSLDVVGAIKSTVTGGSNLFLSKSGGSSIQFDNGSGIANALIEANSASNKLEFWTNNGSALTNRMEILSSGVVAISNSATIAQNLGIGTTSPSNPLDVEGNFAGYAAYIHQNRGSANTDGGLKVETSTTAAKTLTVSNAGTDHFWVNGQGITTANDGLVIPACKANPSAASTIGSIWLIDSNGHNCP